MSDLWIPISILISFTTLLCVTIFFSSKNKKEVQVTLRQLIERGDEITPEILNKLGTFKSSKILDLRRSLIFFSVGVACLLAGLILQHIKLAFAIAIFPLLIGVALFVSWKVNQLED